MLRYLEPKYKGMRNRDEDGSIIRQRVINRDYNGDLTAYKTAMAEKRQETFCWQDIHASAVAYPEYEEEALRQIEYQLGYLPSRSVTLSHEPFIREALFRFDYQHPVPSGLWQRNT